MIQNKLLRKLAILILVISSALILIACKPGSNTPWGDLSDDDIYLEFGDITISEKELYTQLRLQSATALANLIDEKYLADEVAAARELIANNDEDTIEFFEGIVNSAIHGTQDEESLEDLYLDNYDRWERNIEIYVDSLYLVDNSTNIDAVKQALLDLPNTAGNGHSGYASISKLVDYFILRVAQRNYARALLEDEVLDEDSDYYIDEQDLVTYYKNNREGRYDVDALIIRFINLNEANAALYKASIKADSRGLWYLVPDIRILPGNDGYVDLNETGSTGYSHIVTILENLNLLSKLGPNYENRDQLTVVDYENYYRAYVISTTTDARLRDEALTITQVKEKFVEIYNYLNTASQIELDGDSIVGVGGTEFQTTYTYDELTALNTSLRSHLYDTLASADEVDDEDTAAGKPYSARVQTFGNSRYLVFKLSDESASEEGVLIDSVDEDDEEIEIFDPESEYALEIKAEIFDELKESYLTSNYISDKITDLYEDLTVDIYDPVVRTFYENSYGYEGTTKNQSGHVVAKFNDIEITVQELYERLEISYGINLALDIVTNKYLSAHPDYTVTAEQRSEFTDQFNEILQQFSSDQFASAGFPASMGREKFLLLGLGSFSNTEAINQMYIYPELKQQYLDDYNAHYDFEDYTIYEKFADLAALQFNNFKSINVSHLLIYFDANGDGTPDDPQEYLDGLTPEAQEQVLDGLVSLVQKLYHGGSYPGGEQNVGNYRGFAEGLNALATQFNNSGRIFRGENANPPYDYTVEQIWAEYRQLGFYLKYETISSAITNTSNFITGSSVLDTVFYERAIVLHDLLADEDLADPASALPYLDLYDAVITRDALDEVKSTFGYHLILATSVGSTNSAIYSEEDDREGEYVSEDGLLNAYNEDSDTLLASQIEYYLVESETDEGVVLPTAVQTAINSYLQPVLTRYANENFQRELIFKLIAEVEFANPANNIRFNTIREINIRQLDNYLLSTYHDAYYDQLYGTWFAILEAETK